MFYTVITKETFDRVMTLFFRNLGLLDGQAQLKVNELNIQGEEVVIEAEVESETLQ